VDAEDPELLEQQAERSAEAGDFATALALRERAFAAWRVRGDLRRAAYLAAYLIAFDHLALYGNVAVAQGWLERGGHLAEQAGECVEAGWVSLSRALHTREPARRAELVGEALRLARRFDDADLEFDALAHTGLALVEDGRVTEGMRRLDEAAAAARGGEVASPVVAGEIYCKLLVACEDTLDVRRAEEWHPVFTPLGTRRSVAWASAICRSHYGGILVAAGRWDEADRELAEALRLYDASYPALRAGALARLAELRARQGRIGEASELIVGQAPSGYALLPWARTQWLRAADGPERRAVATRLSRALRQQGIRLLDVPILALLTEMLLTCGEVAAATKTVGTMVDLIRRDPVDAMVGYGRLSEARVSARGGGGATGEIADVLDSAVVAFTSARLPLEAAVARLQLAEHLRLVDPGLATAEAQAAADSFEALGASADLDRSTALLRALGGKTRSGPRRSASLTEREEDVLALLSQGLTNPQIAERLYISRKTASHHVSNVLSKLALRNRAEAAAWAARHGLTGRR
jgi:DNA-binding NarL/FixJ family response regulator/tetratricopeptide (TPR) repeat protein